ncbi:MAG: DUF5652 family protein [Candidatus Staskawiczbacteria bacterium]|nr:DUF5652 family protein [Candidatus Staskawiczbacteria bacterium]
MTQKEIELVQFAHLFNNPWFAVLFAVLAVWVLVWKGIALWKAARNNHTAWFVILLIANTFGILEIVYIFFFSKKEKK